MEEEQKIIFTTVYNGGVRIQVKIDEEWCLIENEVVKSLITEAMAKGYSLEKTPRQKYRRVIVAEVPQYLADANASSALY